MASERLSLISVMFSVVTMGILVEIAVLYVSYNSTTLWSPRQGGREAVYNSQAGSLPVRVPLFLQSAKHPLCRLASLLLGVFHRNFPKTFGIVKTVQGV